MKSREDRANSVIDLTHPSQPQSSSCTSLLLHSLQVTRQWRVMKREAQPSGARDMLTQSLKLSAQT